MTFPAALALDAIDSQLVRLLDLHRFDLETRTKTRLFSIGSPQGKQFALIIGDLDPVTKRPMVNQTVIVLPISPVPSIDGVLATGKPYKTQRLRQNDSRLCAPGNRGYLVADEAALRKLLYWYASA